MAIPSGVIRCVLEGTRAANEIMNTGFWLTGATVTSQGDANDFAEAVGTLLSTTYSAAITGLSRSTDVWHGLTTYCYPTGGPLATYIGSFAFTKAGTASAATLPLQTCAVLTLQTGLNGRRNRGRMYLPASGIAVEATAFNFDATTVTTVTTAWQGFMNEWNANISFPSKIAVVSSAGSAAHEVTSIRMDTRPDVQRRRANSQTVSSSVSKPITV